MLKIFGMDHSVGNMRSLSFWIIISAIFMLLFSECWSLTFSGNSSNVFVEKCRRDCASQKDAVVCGRYRVVRWLQDVKEKVRFVFVLIETEKNEVVNKLPTELLQFFTFLCKFFLSSDKTNDRIITSNNVYRHC